MTTKKAKRITVDLIGEAAEDFERLLKERGLTVSGAVRQGLALLTAYDPKQYRLFLRSKDDGKEEEIHFVA